MLLHEIDFSTMILISLESMFKLEGEIFGFKSCRLLIGIINHQMLDNTIKGEAFYWLFSLLFFAT